MRWANDCDDDGDYPDEAAIAALEEARQRDLRRDPFRRRICIYGDECEMRGRNAHLQMYCHPPALCWYGADCFRTNPYHLQDFVHPGREGLVPVRNADALPPAAAASAAPAAAAGGGGGSSHRRGPNSNGSVPAERAERELAAARMRDLRQDPWGRRICKFGDECEMRGRNDHIARFCHPPAICMYGAACYRHNEFHLWDFVHPGRDDPFAPAPYPQPQFVPEQHQQQQQLQQQQQQQQRRPRINYNVPHYWSRGGHQEGYHQLEVKQWFLNRLQDLLDSCVTPNMGIARDQRCPGAYRRLVLTNVWRIEDNARWRRYAHACAQVRDRDDGGLAAMSTPHDLAEYCELLPHKGEVLVFHGTLWESKRSLAMEGFDESLSSPNGLFGCGCYFSDSPSKADQYCTPSDEGVFYMFLCRVAMGRNADLGIAAPRHGATSAPEGFTSVTGRAHERAHREYVVYQGDLVYPEFLLAYYRD